MVGGLIAACGGSDDAGVPNAVDAGSSSGDSGAPAPVQTQTNAAATVGNTGGKVATTEGVGVEIPAGALPNNVQVTVAAAPASAPPPAAEPMGTAHIFGPSGLQFAKPVTVVLEFDPAKLPAGKTSADIVVYTAPEGTTNFSPLPTKVRDATHVEAETTHFSVMVPTIPEAPAGGADAGTPGGDDAGTGCQPRLCGFYGPGTCGAQSDGCNGSLDCGKCAGGQPDGGTGGNDASAPDPDAGSCQNAMTCANYEQAEGPLCADRDDGCGHKIFCSTGCQTGGDGGSGGGTDAGVPNADGGGPCQPKPVTCAPDECVTKNDGCHDIQCFAGCDGGQSGGGGGSDAGAPPDAGGGGPICLGPKVCQPTDCGMVFDGCGNVPCMDGCDGGAPPAQDAGTGPQCLGPKVCQPTDCQTRFDGCTDIQCMQGCGAPDGGSGGGGATDAGGPCVPQSCGSYAPKCGLLPDGCGGPMLDCPCPP